MGARMALLLAEGPFGISQLWLIARRRERLLSLQEQIRRRNPRIKVRCLEGDLLSDAFFDTFSAELSRETPRILFLVNGAGFGKIGSVSALALKQQEAMLRLNCLALFRMTKLCLPYMKEGAGRIINFASAAAFLPQPGFAVYAAGKSFVLSFSEALNEELRNRRISVTAVCPGPVKTEFFGIAEEFRSVPFYKKLAMADPDRVTRLALSDSLRRKPVSVYGAGIKGLRLMTKLLPAAPLFAAMRLFR